MQYPNDSRRCLTVLDQDSTLIAVIEMSLSSWLVAGIGGREREVELARCRHRARHRAPAAEET